MTRFAIWLLPLLLVPLSGCTEEDGSIEADIITPGQWSVRGNPDYILAWVHNSHDREVEVEWHLSDETPLPAGWNLTFATAKVTLKPMGSKVMGAGGYEYPDWASTLVTLSRPILNESSNRTLDLNLTVGGESVPINLTITDPPIRVSKAGDTVNVKYKGTFTDNGEVFDPGTRPFDTKLGSGQTVDGFDYGLMGLALNEQAILVIPPALGYGYDQTSPDRTKFNGRSMTFDVEIRAFK